MAISADNWLLTRYPDTTCGGVGTINVNLVKQRCPDCEGTGLNERRIAEDTGKGLIPQWVLDQRTIRKMGSVPNVTSPTGPQNMMGIPGSWEF